MNTQLVIRGLPTRIARDAWWFSDTPATPNTDNGPASVRPRDNTRPPPRALGAAGGLVVLADLLFWDADLGISVALYTLALAACMLALKPSGVTWREVLIALGGITVCVLPAIELVQPLSVGFCVVGIGGLLIWITLGAKPKFDKTIDMLFDVGILGPFTLPVEAASDLRCAAHTVDLSALARITALPLGVGVVFLGLFAVANPLLDNMLSAPMYFEDMSPNTVTRPVFWILGACLIWPILQAHARWTDRAHAAPKFALPATGLINGGSVRSSLIVFNMLFAVQTLSDIVVLTGGVSLPEGMTYAQYAHRGAYPLLATALLSGLIAMATQRLVVGNAFLRGLMFAWLGQTLFLVLTAAVRLATYVDAYSLTYLRVAAFIWMALIFVGIVLIIVQIVQDRPFAWLLSTNLAVVTGTLYLCCFVNFAYLITEYNVNNANPEALDLAYLCALGEQVIPAMMDYGQITDETACGRGHLPSIQFNPIEDWQEWGFRRWRLQRYLVTYHDL